MSVVSKLPTSSWTVTGIERAVPSKKRCAPLQSRGYKKATGGGGGEAVVRQPEKGKRGRACRSATPLWDSPLSSPEGAYVRCPPQCPYENTREFRVQDEPLLRSETLKLYLNLEVNWLIYQQLSVVQTEPLYLGVGLVVYRFSKNYEPSHEAVCG